MTPPTDATATGLKEAIARALHDTARKYGDLEPFAPPFLNEFADAVLALLPSASVGGEREALVAWRDAQQATDDAVEHMECAIAEGWYNEPGGTGHVADSDRRADAAWAKAIALRDAALAAPETPPTGNAPTPPALSEDLREALKPFADIADFYDSCEQHPNGCPDSETTGEMVNLTVGDFRRARAALARAQEQAS